MDGIGNPQVTRFDRDLNPPGTGLRRVPLLGLTPAGGPEEVEGGELRTLEIPDTFGRCDHLAALEVRGDSMVEAHIVPGDVVVVHRQTRAEPGDLVVVETPEGWTLKRWDPRGAVVRLRSDNVRIPDRWYPSGAVRVWGVVVGVLRKYR